jgi:tRNA(fMet)-specific endonuclease VapC
MFAFDTDVLTRLFQADRSVLQKISAIPARQQFVPIVVVEEILRGRLNTIRQAERGRAGIGLERAYELLGESLADLLHFNILLFTAAANRQFETWRRPKLRVPTHDLRIAAICVTESATLVSSNRRHFDQVPDLVVEYW